MPIVVSLAEDTSGPIDLADVKVHLDIDESDESADVELAGFLGAAIEVVEGIVGPISPTSYTETHYGRSGGPIFLHHAPVIAVQELGTPTYAYSVEDLTVDTGMGAIIDTAGYALRGNLTVTYTAGRATVPAAVRLAVLIIVAHLWETQRGAAPLPFGGPDAEVPLPGQGFAIPRRAEELLAPFLLAPVLA